MLLGDLWRFFHETIFAEPSTPTLFNQYKDADRDFDKPGAVAIRRTNLKNYLSYFIEQPTILLVGEAPGPNGCRFSGVAFTSEHQLVSGLLRFQGCQSSNRERPYKEPTATTFWRAVMAVESRVSQRALVWNCVPFHPHGKDEPMSIRAPTAAEIHQYAHILRGVIHMLKCERVVSIGNHAARAIRELDVATEHVRHPSHGGVAEFKIGLKQVFSR